MYVLKSVLVAVIVLVIVHHEVQCRVVQEMFDLTWGFDDKSIEWGNLKKFEITNKLRLNVSGQWIAMNDISTNEHTGTHMDAPYHFNKKGAKVGDIPIDRLIGPGMVLDMTYDVLLHGANTTVQPYHLEEWVNTFGPMIEGSYLLIRFGWSRFYRDRDTYMGFDSDGKTHFPGISKAAAEWMANCGKIIGVGVDTASFDPNGDLPSYGHITFANNNMYGLENVNIPQELPANGFTLYVMPMKITEGTGAPVRLMAIKDQLLYINRK